MWCTWWSACALTLTHTQAHMPGGRGRIVNMGGTYNTVLRVWAKNGERDGEKGRYTTIYWKGERWQLKG